MLPAGQRGLSPLLVNGASPLPALPGGVGWLSRGDRGAAGPARTA